MLYASMFLLSSVLSYDFWIKTKKRGGLDCLWHNLPIQLSVFPLDDPLACLSAVEESKKFKINATHQST